MISNRQQIHGGYWDFYELSNGGFYMAPRTDRQLSLCAVSRIWSAIFVSRASTTVVKELIANMLGVRREGVTEAAGKLHAQGAIEYGRGKITVLNRRLLEMLCCECYAVVKK